MTRNSRFPRPAETDPYEDELMLLFFCKLAEVYSENCPEFSLKNQIYAITPALHSGLLATLCMQHLLPFIVKTDSSPEGGGPWENLGKIFV